jgi:hypothetical protein
MESTTSVQRRRAYYLDRATEAELKAEQSNDTPMRDSWRKVAASWRALAEQTERTSF